MASYHLNVGIVSRGKGHSATAAAAYQHRTAIHDERLGLTFDYSNHRNKVLFSGIYAPANAPSWIKDRQLLWNAAEHAEDKSTRPDNAQVARNFTIALPHELTTDQQRWLLQDFVKENFTRKGYVADVAIHAPHEHGDERNVHAHILVSMRTIGPDGFAPKKDRAMNAKERVEEWRESYARIGNAHLARRGFEPSLDHRSLKAQGVKREAQIHLGKSAGAMERKGERTPRGDRLAAIHQRNARRGHGKGTSRGSLRRLLELADAQDNLGHVHRQSTGAQTAPEGKPMAWQDRAMHTLESTFAGLLDFGMGGDPWQVRGGSAESVYRDPDKPQTPDIHIHGVVNDHTRTKTAQPVQGPASDTGRVENWRDKEHEMLQAQSVMDVIKETHPAPRRDAEERAFMEAQLRNQERDLERE